MEGWKDGGGAPAAAGKFPGPPGVAGPGAAGNPQGAELRARGSGSALPSAAGGVTGRAARRRLGKP